MYFYLSFRMTSNLNGSSLNKKALSAEPSLDSLAEQILVALRLGQHGRVAKLCTDLQQYLVAKFEEELEKEQFDEDTTNDADSLSGIGGGGQRSLPLQLLPSKIIEGQEWRLMATICASLQTLSKVAATYNEVLEFVRVYDLISFSRLVGATSAVTSEEEEEEEEEQRQLQQQNEDKKESLKGGHQGEKEHSDVKLPETVQMLPINGRPNRIDLANYEQLQITLRQSISLLIELNRSRKHHQPSQQPRQQQQQQQQQHYETLEQQICNKHSTSTLISRGSISEHKSVEYDRYHINLTEPASWATSERVAEKADEQEEEEQEVAIEKTASGNLRSSQTLAPDRLLYVDHIKRSLNEPDDSDGTMANVLMQQLKSSSNFQTLVDRFLLEPYRLDRFPLLVSLWIIGSRAKHVQLEQLMCELCDQIFHQEANSCHLEELMQLTQVGSFWITYKKRFQVTLKRVNFAPSLGLVLDDENMFNDEEGDDDYDDDDHDDDDDEGDENVMEFSENSEQPSKLKSITTTKNETTRQINFESRLRKLIDNELLVGRECPLCHREPSGQLLEPIQTAIMGCPECGLEKPNEMYCSLSYETFQLIGLPSIQQAINNNNDDGANFKVDSLLLLRPNEWVSFALNARRQEQKHSPMSSGPTNTTHPSIGINNISQDKISSLSSSDTNNNEKIDISDKFERLTVIRNSRGSDDEEMDEDDNDIEDTLDERDSNGASESETSRDDGDDDDSSTTSSTSSTISDDTQTTTRGLIVVKQFMESRLKKSAGQVSTASETIQIVEYLRNILSGAGGVDSSVMESRLRQQQQQQHHQQQQQQQRRQQHKHSTQVPICSSDLIICDSLADQFVDVCVQLVRGASYLGGNNTKRQSGLILGGLMVVDYDLIYACKARLPLSKLPSGCNRYYSQMSLARLSGHLASPDHLMINGDDIITMNQSVQSPKLSEAVCPHCGAQLMELRPGFELMTELP